MKPEPKEIPWNWRERANFLSGFLFGISFAIAFLGFIPGPTPFGLRVIAVVSFLLLLFLSRKLFREAKTFEEWNQAESSLRILNQSLPRPSSSKTVKDMEEAIRKRLEDIEVRDRLAMERESRRDLEAPLH